MDLAQRTALGHDCLQALAQRPVLVHFAVDLERRGGEGGGGR